MAIVWDYYQPYHVARLEALRREGSARGIDVVGLAGGGGGCSRDFHSIDADGEGRGPDVIVGGENEDLGATVVARRIVNWLATTLPSAVLIPGYGTRSARALLRACRRLRIASVVMSDSQERDCRRVWWRELIKRFLLRGVGAALCAGVSQRAYAAKLGIPLNRTFDGYDVVDNLYWANGAAMGRACRPSSAAPVVIGVGRFIEKKNFSGLIREFSTFAKSESGQRYRLVLVGDGPERSALEAAAVSYGLVDRVDFLGYLPACEIAQQMGRADIFVMPSIREEQWGLVVNEALAAGLPAIVSNVCGCVEDLIEHRVTGLVFDPRADGELAAAMGELAANSARRLEIARLGRERVQKFSPEYFATQAFRAVATARLNMRGALRE